MRGGLGYLAAADATAMAAGTQARLLRMLEQAHSMSTAARTSVLATFTSGQGYCADAVQSAGVADQPVGALGDDLRGRRGAAWGPDAECASVVGTVLDALSAPAGAEDSRTRRSGSTTGCRKLCAASSRLVVL